MLSSYSPLPAYLTKHLSPLQYPFRQHTFYLSQLNDGTSNGTALWLGAQCLSVYLAETYHNKRPSQANQRLKVLELGSGIGLTALTMSSLGWDVLATDLPHIISSVLAPNISRNLYNLPDDTGSIKIRELDWTSQLPPDEWCWTDPHSITSSSPSISSEAEDSIKPPFDLVVTADTIYIPELTEPLLRTLHSLSVLSHAGSPEPSRSPSIFICLERRDPTLVDRFFVDAKDVWHFNVEQVPRKKVLKAMEKGGLKWQRDDWEDIEIWKLTWDHQVDGLNSTA